MTTDDPNYSPWDLLPAPEPATDQPPDTYFYDNVAKHLIKDTVRIMGNGLHIDLDKVSDLEATLDTQLDKVTADLASNPIISEFQKLQCKALKSSYIADRRTKLRDPSYYEVPFKHSDMVHRSYFMHIWSERMGHPSPTDLLPTGVPKWPANLCKKFPDPIIRKLLSGDLDDANPIVQQALTLLFQHKADIYNQKFLDQINNPQVDCPPFNPSSPKQKQALFAHLGIPAEKTSKDTGQPSYDRAEIERIHAETADPDIKHLTQAFIDHSFAAIVRNNFIEAFYKYTIQDRLYGTYRLLGAKSG